MPKSEWSKVKNEAERSTRSRQKTKRGNIEAIGDLGKEDFGRVKQSEFLEKMIQINFLKGSFQAKDKRLGTAQGIEDFIQIRKA